MASNSTILGAAGEHYVVSQLMRRGVIAALAPTGVPNTDIIVTNQIGDRVCAVQVKTRVEKGRDRGWHMSLKHERISAPSMFYTFVDVRRSVEDQPLCCAIPRSAVADAVHRSHAAWLAQPGKRRQQWKDTDVRRFLSDDWPGLGVDIGCGEDWLDKYRDACAHIIG